MSTLPTRSTSTGRSHLGRSPMPPDRSIRCLFGCTLRLCICCRRARGTRALSASAWGHTPAFAPPFTPAGLCAANSPARFVSSTLNKTRTPTLYEYQPRSRSSEGALSAEPVVSSLCVWLARTQPVLRWTAVASLTAARSEPTSLVDLATMRVASAWTGTRSQADDAVIGGGLSGLCLANGLLNEKVDCVVYEREQMDACAAAS